MYSRVPNEREPIRLLFLPFFLTLMFTLLPYVFNMYLINLTFVDLFYAYLLIFVLYEIFLAKEMIRISGFVQSFMYEFYTEYFFWWFLKNYGIKFYFSD